MAKIAFKVTQSRHRDSIYHILQLSHNIQGGIIKTEPNLYYSYDITNTKYAGITAVLLIHNQIFNCYNVKYFVIY